MTTADSPVPGTPTEWDEVARVYRSPCHNATWIGFRVDAVQDDASIPAGPLRVVKAYMLKLVEDDPIDRHRWRRHEDGSGYDLEVVWRA